MQLAIACDYKKRCLLVKEVLRYERCHMALDKIFQRGGSGRECTTAVSSKDVTSLLPALLLHTKA